MTRNTVLISIVACLAACSSVEERRIANGGFGYLDSQQQGEIKLPPDAQTPEYSNDYAIPSVDNKTHTPIGKKIEVVSPTVVMPLVTGSHIEEGSKKAIVWFDQVRDDKELDTAIWDSLISFLEERDIGVTYFNKEEQLLITDWLTYNEMEDSAWYDWTSTEREVGKRFEFRLEKKSHGRSAALTAKLTDYKESLQGKQTVDMAQADVRANEVDILNKVISHYQDQLRRDDVRRIREIREGLTTELGFNAKGDPAFIVDGTYTVTWPRLLLVFRKLGFNVKDLDQSSGLLFVEYIGSDLSWWDKLWGGDDNELSLDETDYRVQLEEIEGDKTSISFMNEDNEPFEAQAMSDIYEAFSAVMAEKNLDL
ncbi:outer membrane protein assembly factor BamC [Neptunicella sp. SCSIO 80796]|uniref:outer membrane protein assembly factor BamC n=1 Tax=Neptunicella plasticusilytica TaxID=3117012 RepID=UPI003A4DD238